MLKTTLSALDPLATTHPGTLTALARNLVIGLIAFLTVVDLFATQALLPALVVAYQVSPAVMGTAVNSGTLGMALAGLVVGTYSRYIDRRLGVVASLALLAVPTALLGLAPDLATFTMLRIAQGLLMATAFTLTLAYFAETTQGSEASTAVAAYITGNVASNLFGRLLATSIADMAGLATSFYIFAFLNLAGAVIAYFVLNRMALSPPAPGGAVSPIEIWRQHIINPPLRIAFAIGFCILFAFIGTFTYINFVLVRPPLSLGMMSVGLVYFVFLPSILTTPLAGRAAARLGVGTTLICALALAGAGLPLLLIPSLVSILAGLALVGVGTFLAQATATGLVARSATIDPGSASGMYLASYFFGGLVGSAVLGELFVRFGWPACVGGIGVALLVAGALASRLRIRPADHNSRQA